MRKNYFYQVRKKSEFYNGEKVILLLCDCEIVLNHLFELESSTNGLTPFLSGKLWELLISSALKNGLALDNVTATLHYPILFYGDDSCNPLSMVQDIQTQALEFGNIRIDLANKICFGIHIGNFNVDITDVKYPEINNIQVESICGPPVNICGRFVKLKEKYKCSTIFSRDIIEICHTHLNKRCRLIDRIIPRSFKQEIDIFTFDYLNITIKFIESFNQGLTYYLNGNWGKASEYLKKAENFFSNDNNGAMDGPTHILLNRIKSFEIENNNALESKSLSPHSWRGYFDWNNRS